MRRLALLVVPLIILLIALIGGNPLVWRLFILSLVLIGFGYLWLKMQTHGLSGRLKKPPQRCQAGQPFNLSAEIVNNSLIPKPFLKINVGSQVTTLENGNQIGLDSNDSYDWQSRVIIAQRGHYRIGPLSAEVSDPFGLVHKNHKLDEPEYIMVYPNIVDLPYFWAGSQAISGTGDDNRTSRGEGSSIFGIREYQPGDSLNRIHWKSTAHSGKLVVKELTSNQAKKAWIVLDLSRDSQAGAGLESTEEYQVQIAASLINKYAEDGYQVGMAVHANEFQVFPARQGQINMWRLLESLALFQAKGEAPFSQVVMRSRNYFDNNSIVIIITADGGADLIDTLTQMEKRGASLALVLLDFNSFNNHHNGSPLKKPAGLNMPVYIVKKGDNLGETLNNQGQLFALNLHGEKILV